MEQLNVIASPLPFSTHQVKKTAALGSSIKDILDEVIPERHIGVVDAIVTLNGIEIPRHIWHVVRPKCGVVINIRVVPMGGKGKNPLTTLLSIAVMIAAPYAAGAVLGATLAGTVAFGTVTYGTILSGAISLVARMAISALAPPPKQSGAGNATGNTISESPTQFIEGARNSLDPFGVVPICLGTNRMVPKLAARTYTETENNDQYARQLFDWGFGEKLEITDLKIGETAITEFNSYDIEHKLDGDLSEGTSLYTNDVFQEDFNILLLQADGYAIRSTQLGIDEVILDFTFPRGIAQFNTEPYGRVAIDIQLEAGFAPSGSGDWSPTAKAYKAVTGDTVTFNPVLNVGDLSYRSDLVVLDKYTNLISVIEGDSTSGTAVAPALPYQKIRLATCLIKTDHTTSTTTLESFTDDRAAELFGNAISGGSDYLFKVAFENSTDFAPSQSGNSIVVASGGIAVNELTVTQNTSEAVRVSLRMIMPSNGDYDIRVRRLTQENNDDKIFDDAYFTSIKSVKYQSPVTLEGINGTALRIKGTDQLNGSVDQLNAIVSNIIPDYDLTTDTWITRKTSNPASIYRHVLQSVANDKRLSDSEINLDTLAEWHGYCDEKGYTYNRVIDYETSIEEVLRDVASSGFAAPAIIDGKRTVVVDSPKDEITQIFTPRNSWDYKGEMTYINLPQGFRVVFRNKLKGYQQDEVIVYDDGYNAENATLFETLELLSCTDSDLAFKIARRHIATARLQPETHSFMVDVENLVSLRGDRVKLFHDVPLVGVGHGRIKSVITSGSPLEITGITIDDEVTLPVSSSYHIRIRLNDGTFLYKQLNETIGTFTTLTFVEPFDAIDAPQIGDLFGVSQTGQELDLLITRIEPQEDMSARIVCVNYAPERFDADTATIPEFQSKVTLPIDFIRPLPPVLLSSQSAEDAILINSDGSLISRAIFTFENQNTGIITPLVKIRRSGDTLYTNANILEASPERVVITGLEDNKRYDILFFYKREGSNSLSPAYQLSSYLFVGSSGLPDDVTNFKISILENVAILSWDINTDIDLSHYKLKYSPLFSGATWEGSLTVENTIYENRITVPFSSGTYFVKAVDLTGNESENAASIITSGFGDINNVVETLTESPTFGGIKEDVEVSSGSLVLTGDESTGYYYFLNDIDLGGVYNVTMSANFTVGADFINPMAGSDLFLESDIFAIADVFGIGAGAFDVRIEIRTTNDNPSGSPTWSAWEELNAANYQFRGAEFRCVLISLQDNVTPVISTLEVIVDMQDRIERGEDLTVPTGGATITYPYPFKNNPAVAIALQDGLTGDEIQFTSKTSSGFSFKVYNTVTAGFVERTYDYIASGYGREE